jgi:hypothetical protein
MGSNGSYLPSAPLAEREFSPQVAGHVDRVAEEQAALKRWRAEDDARVAAATAKVGLGFDRIVPSGKAVLVVLVNLV